MAVITPQDRADYEAYRKQHPEQILELERLIDRVIGRAVASQRDAVRAQQPIIRETGDPAIRQRDLGNLSIDKFKPAEADAIDAAAHNAKITFSVSPQIMSALQWFGANEPASWFDAKAPNHTRRINLEKRGYITNVGTHSKSVYQLTPYARRMLKEGGEL